MTAAASAPTTKITATGIAERTAHQHVFNLAALRDLSSTIRGIMPVALGGGTALTA